MKASNLKVTYEFLNKRSEDSTSKGFQKQKWIQFCETVMDRGFRVELYEARRTFSKYVTVIGFDKEFKVRFSNHKPIAERELKGDCDFFVGVTHTGWRTTDDALKALTEYFGETV